MPSGQTPRAWQVEATDAVRAAYRRGILSPIVHAATGTGKGTLLAGLAAASARAGWRVLGLVHRRELVEDLASRTAVLGCQVGIVQGPRNQSLAQVVYAMVPSMRSRLDDVLGMTGRDGAPAPFDLIITDECHHAPAPSYAAIYEAVRESRRRAGRRPAPLHIGMTATPFRSDGDGGTIGLGGVYDAVVYSHGIVEAIAAGDLVPPVGIKIQTHVRLDGVRVTRGGDYDEDELQRVVDTDERNRLIVAKYREHGQGRPLLAFACTVEHAQNLAAAFQADGLDVHAVWGDMPRDERDRLIDGYRAGQVLGLVSRDLLFEGFDAPRCSCLLRARPTRSRVIAVQMVGRGLRLAPGKSDCLVLDFVDEGIDLSLDVEVDLTTPGGSLSTRSPRPLQAGDRVRHRYDDRGIGGVLEADDLLATVLWPDGDELRHGVHELRLCRDDEAAALPLDLRVVGVTEYALELLPGDTPTAGSGWYLDGDVWSCEGRAGRGRDADGLVVIVRKLSSGRWPVWAVRSPQGRQPPTARKLGEVADLDTARAAGLQWMRRQGDTGTDYTADWRARSASDGQRGLLQRLRVARPLDGLTMGEASCLIASRRARQAINREIRGSRAAYYDPTPSPAMLRAARQIAEQGNVDGIAARTLAGLRRRGLVKGDDLTDRGRQATR